MRKLFVLLIGLAVVAGLQAQVLGGISGHVTNAQNQAPIMGATLTARGSSQGQAYSDSTGFYLIDLPDGVYFVSATASGFEPAMHPDTIVVTGGQVVPDIDFALVPSGGQTGGISGMVTNARNSQPIHNAHIVASGPGHGEAYSGLRGDYLIEDLTPGFYVVTASASGFLPAYDSVLVEEGQVTPDVDFALVPDSGGGSGGISGRVTNAQNQAPIMGATLIARGSSQGQAYSDSTGFYLIELPDGVYFVSATAPGFEPAMHPDTIVVTGGQITPDIDFALVPTGGQTGGISGIVTNVQNSQPIHNAHIVASGPGHGEAYSSIRGDYLVEDLMPGFYLVTASASGFLPAYDSVLVQEGQITPDIDFALVPDSGGGSGGISGRVIDVRTQRPIIGAVITAAGPNGRGMACSDTAGFYQILQLHAGLYVVSAQAYGYRPATYPDSVAVVGGQVTSNINFALEPDSCPDGGIAGIVTNARTSEPIFGALVVAHGPDQGQANSGMRGDYHIRNLGPGVYAVQATARGFRPSAWDTVTVQVGQVTRNVNFALVPDSGGGRPGSISGAVKDSADQSPIPGAVVFAWGPGGQGQAIADSAGNYLIANLGPGPYRVWAMARGYYPATYPDVVQVQPGQTTPDIDFFLLRVRDGDAGIAGFVYDGETQSVVSGALVTATGTTDNGQAYTDDNGDYVIDDLEPGEYEITVTAEGFHPGAYPEPVTVEIEVVASFISPPLYPLTGIMESPGPKKVTVGRLTVEPNPFFETASIRWQVKEQGCVTLRVFDNTGRMVRTLVDSRLESGSHSAVWNGRDCSGRKLARGTYFIELRTTTETVTTKSLLLD